MSRLMIAASCSGVLPAGDEPSVCSRSTVSRDFSTAATSLLMRSVTGRGSPFGPASSCRESLRDEASDQVARSPGWIGDDDPHGPGGVWLSGNRRTHSDGREYG